MIPIFDLKAQYLSIKKEIDEAVSEVIRSGHYIKGEAVSRFENAFADYLGIKYCLGVGNGTDAIELILKALDIGEGSEVLVPALSWISTAEAVNNTGAEPVFTDVDPVNLNIDPYCIEEKITARTKAIIAVHLYGHPAMMNRLEEIAGKYDLFIIEDCAQAHGAEFKGARTGTFGIASAFSFFPTKNLGGYGDGGAVVTNNSILYEKICRLANHGQFGIKHQHAFIGRNSRLDEIQAAILEVKLKHLDEWNRQRIAKAEIYSRLLMDIVEVILPGTYPEYKDVFHLYVIKSDFRNHIMEYMKKHDIASAIHYPKPLPFTEAYSYKKHIKSDFPVAYDACNKILSIPLYPEINEGTIEKISRVIKESISFK